MSEPDPERAPVRRGFNGEVAKHTSLSEIRPKITAIDARIAGLLAARAELVIDAGYFKRDSGENAAPAQQQRNIDNAVQAAREFDTVIPGFSYVIEQVWGTLVPAFVDLQRQAMEHTVLIDEVIDPVTAVPNEFYMSPGHRLEPEIWDFGGIPHYREGIIARWERKYPTPI